MLSRGDVASPSASAAPDDQPSEGRNLHRILVATDGSASSVRAISVAVELASEQRSEVLIVHVVPAVDSAPATGTDEVGAAAGHERTEPDHAVLEEASAFASKHGVAATLGSVSVGVLRASKRPVLIVDGESSVSYCGNGSCPDVRILKRS